MQRVAIIDYGSGNLHSAAKAFERAARESEANAEIVVTSDPVVVRAANRVVLPGVGLPTVGTAEERGAGASSVGSRCGRLPASTSLISSPVRVSNRH